MRVRHVTVVVVALLLSACSIGRPFPVANTYSIELPPAPSEALRPPHPARLRVERVRVAAPYDRSALVYRVTDVRYVLDPYHAFLGDPGPMLSNRIAEWLSEADSSKLWVAPKASPRPLGCSR